MRAQPLSRANDNTAHPGRESAHQPGSRYARLESCPLALVVAALCAASAFGQTPVVQPRQVAALAPAGDYPAVWEPHVAIGATRAVTVFNDGRFQLRQTRIGYAVFNLSTGQWTSQGQIQPEAGMAIDPSIAYEPAIAIDGPEQEGAEPLLGNNFLAAALVGGDVNALAVARFDPQTERFGNWLPTLTLGEPPRGDKPWLVRGELLPSGWEYYITLWAKDHYLYVRSVDSGRNWLPNDANEAIIRVGEEVVQGLFCAQPAVRGSGPLYVAIRGLDNAIRILQGTDRPDGGVDFDYLRSAGGVLVIPRNRSDFSECFPNYPRMGVSYAVSTPQLAIDPNDPNRLYLAYQDTASDSPADRDVNIYFQLIRKIGNSWIADPRVLVHPDDQERDDDQCLPQLTARPGWIEIAFYDDRKYEQNDGSENPKLDVFYARSERDPIDFSRYPNQELCAHPSDCAPDDPANHFVVDQPNDPHHSIGEYFGIDARGRRSFVVFCGTHPYPNPTQYILWGTEIVWQP